MLFMANARIGEFKGCRSDQDLGMHLWSSNKGGGGLGQGLDGPSGAGLGVAGAGEGADAVDAARRRPQLLALIRPPRSSVFKARPCASRWAIAQLRPRKSEPSTSSWLMPVWLVEAPIQMPRDWEADHTSPRRLRKVNEAGKTARDNSAIPGR